MKKISFVTGVFNEEAIVEDVYLSIKKTINKIGKYDYEHIFMDNCSTDRTFLILERIAAKDKRVKVLSFSKNFGPINSGFTGLKYASGDAVIPYEASMKDPLNLIPIFIKYWEQEYDLVYGIRKKTSDNFPLMLMRKIFYRFIKFLSTEDLLLDFGSFALIDKKIVDAIKDVDDYKPYVRGLIAAAGYKRKGIEYVRGSRQKGKSKSNFRYLIDYAINGIINFSTSPIRLCTYLGLSLSIVSLLTAIVYLFLKLFYWKVTVPGVSAAILFILIFSGIQLFFLGVIGEYIGAIHSQVRKKPFVIIKEKINI